MARYYYDDVIDERRERTGSSAWFPILLIPLLLLAGYIGFGMANQYDGNQNTRTEYGVGGAPPEEISPTVITPVTSPTPTDIEPTASPSPTRSVVPTGNLEI